jgi:hypothetical protein
MPATQLEEEIRAIEGAIRALDDALEDLQRAAVPVARQLAEADSVAKPNYRRAEQQVRTATNATMGAQSSLRRRLALRREALQRERRRAEEEGV